MLVCVSFPCVWNLYCVELHMFKVIWTIQIYYMLLFIIIKPGFGLSLGFWISADLVGSEFSPEQIFGLNLSFRFGYGFGCPHTTSDPNPTHCHIITICRQGVISEPSQLADNLNSLGRPAICLSFALSHVTYGPLPSYSFLLFASACSTK
jgi:hypothetical protein